jgi:hypothetical protein
MTNRAQSFSRRSFLLSGVAVIALATDPSRASAGRDVYSGRGAIAQIYKPYGLNTPDGGDLAIMEDRMELLCAFHGDLTTLRSMIAGCLADDFARNHRVEFGRVSIPATDAAIQLLLQQPST